MIANLQFWYRYCTGISFCVVSLKLIYCIMNDVPSDFNENAAALQQQLGVVCAVLQSLFQLLLSGSWADPGVETFFNNAFDKYNFSIISNLFDNISSYALYQYTEMENVRKNCIIPVFGEDLKIKGKIFKYNLP